MMIEMNIVFLKNIWKGYFGYNYVWMFKVILDRY